MEKQSTWPLLEFDKMKDTLALLHQYLQIIGKVRLRSMPWQNHSWHCALYISPRGFTTGGIPFKEGMFSMEFDMIAHQLRIHTSNDQTRSIALFPKTVADFYTEVLNDLHNVGIDVKIHGSPNEMEPAIPFSQNTENYNYDPDQAHALWQAMIKISAVFQSFRSSFLGKVSPVHLFWGAFDLAVTRFSGRTAPLHPGGMPNMSLEVMQEAYSHEVSSAGFWPGSADFPVPVFYAYAYPTPEGFSKQPIAPKEAFYDDNMGEFFLKYEDVRIADNPEETLLQFLQTTYEAAANTGNWDRNALEVKR